MKTKSIFSVIILIAFSLSVNGQIMLSDFLIIEKNYSGKAELEKSMKNSENVFFNNSSTSAISQMASILKGKSINNLHFFIQTEPGKMIFEGMTMTIDNISDFSENLKELATIISGRVIIHSNSVFAEEEGILLKQKLEEITGLPFEIRNTRNN